MSLTIPVILGSVRADRNGLRAARFLVAQIEARGHTAPLVDPVELDLPLLDRMYKEYPKGEAPETLERLAAFYRNADAFIVVSAEYNHSIPPALSNTLDHFLEEYYWRPSAICCYSAGQYGGVRAAMQLRAMMAELGAPSIPSLLPIPRVHKALTETGESAEEWLPMAAHKFVEELTWYAEALRAKRATGTPY
jgi:NAD(P)H-dependent FMN reductase